MNIKVNPEIFLAIVILSFVFFISGLLHLLVRILLNRNQRYPQSPHAVTVLQGQLQQLFHLHDAGVNQSFIDALPIFYYKSITGTPNTFDCAVCLCEFEPEDKLRSLPKCTHAFHMGCIDTWLLSHSTCPLCRSSLLTDVNTRDNPREFESNPNLDSQEMDLDLESSVQICNKSMEIVDESEMPIKLGKFRKADVGGGEEDVRRCLSMGSFQYVVDEKSLLRVPIRAKGSTNNRGLIRGLTAAMSECDCESIREFDGLETCKSSVEGEIKVIGSGSGRCESWRRGFSFKFPVHRGNTSSSSATPQIVEDSRRAVSEIDFRRWEMGKGGQDDDNRVDCGSKAPSFARRTLDWLMGREGKVLQDSFSSDA